MTTSITLQMAALSPKARSIVLDLANQNRPVLRKDAYSALISISLEERGGLSLAEGRKHLADLANAVRSFRFNRQHRYKQNYGCGLRSPRANERAKLANRLTCSITERIRLHTRSIVTAAAKSIMPGWAIDGAGWLVYSADLKKRRHVDYKMTIEVNRRSDSHIRPFEAVHTIVVSQGWHQQIRRIGLRTGVVEGCLILSSRRVAHTASEELEIFEVRFARLQEKNLMNGIAYISSGRHQKIKMYQSFGQACDDWRQDHIFGMIDYNDSKMLFPNTIC
ncbi:hypothetical protein [Methylobacterium aquaticum]|uniref:hypothetical protein n=1 Tax=Methylobacterium aquaticum TaxID=270351 RepID=UPI0019349DEC|nr:hypothetical protein [Methylobacterium aquaticum]QRE76759.1 hypothetical protein F1D61_27280 [Methylobacterium aquaticum]